MIVYHLITGRRGIIKGFKKRFGRPGATVRFTNSFPVWIPIELLIKNEVTHQTVRAEQRELLAELAPYQTED